MSEAEQGKPTERGDDLGDFLEELHALIRDSAHPRPEPPATDEATTAAPEHDDPSPPKQDEDHGRSSSSDHE